MASKKEFTAIQAKLDEIGIITCINRIIANKQYEVIVNGEIVKNINSAGVQRIIY